jgi:SDR family mycofactocin-dependent oxidoreductase
VTSTTRSDRFAGKVAFITGAARGQGRAHALTLAGEGADILALDLAGPLPGVPYESSTPEDLKETARLVEALGRRVLTHEGDVRDFDDLKEFVDRGVADFGRLDVVVANAGIAIPATWDETTPAVFKDTIDINVTGVWNTVMASAPHVVAGGRGGSIVLTSSYAGKKMQPFMVHYTASKHAVTGMARAFAAELGRHSIRVNSVHPGAVNTLMGSGDMIGSLGRAIETYPQLAQMITPFLPSWAAEPEDIADTVCWLASEESKNVTAAAISVDQGMTQY